MARHPETEIVSTIVLPDALPCRLSVGLTAVNPYEIRICDWSRGRARSPTLEARFAAFALEIACSGRKSITPTAGPGLELAPGTIAALSPGTYQLDESADYRARLLFFNERFPGDFLQQNFSSVPLPSALTAIGCNVGEGGARAVDDAIDSVLAGPTFAPCRARVLLQDTFLRMLAVSPSDVRGFVAAAALRDHGGLPAFIAAHAAEGLSNRELARKSGRSLSAFHRQFVATFGTTPQRWLMERRLQRAKVLLSSSSLPITEIAYETGFRDPAHFSRAFKQRFGTPPRALRRSGLASRDK